VKIFDAVASRTNTNAADAKASTALMDILQKLTALAESGRPNIEVVN
jgi:hypothetical protein